MKHIHSRDLTLGNYLMFSKSFSGSKYLYKVIQCEPMLELCLVLGDKRTFYISKDIDVILVSEDEALIHTLAGKSISY